MINLYNQDCLEAMKKMPDNKYALAIVDPPYSINFGDYSRTQDDKLRKRHQKKEWDKSIPTDEYFLELYRVSKNQIIWGGNYFPFLWAFACKGFIYWHKGNLVPNFNDGELAWTSFNVPAKQFDYRYYGNLKGNTSATPKIHQTQKPISLYEWTLMNYAKEGDKILDTHGGSMSIAIACDNLNFDLDLWEIDKDYFEAGAKRLEQHKKQLKLF